MQGTAPRKQEFDEGMKDGGIWLAELFVLREEERREDKSRGDEAEGRRRARSRLVKVVR
jgi:hypothetical protein